MEKALFQDITQSKRIVMLRDNAEDVEEIGYMKRFTPDQLSQMKSQLSETDIEINDIEIEKSETIKTFKDRLTPLTAERKELLSGLKNKAVHVKEQCYKFIDRDQRMVGFYNSEGELIEARPTTPNEMQLSIMEFKKTGTED